MELFDALKIVVVRQPTVLTQAHPPNEQGAKGVTRAKIHLLAVKYAP